VTFARIARSLVALLALGSLLGACEPEAPGRLDAAASDPALVDIDGSTIDLTELHGPVLLNFWSTTCRTCLEEIPKLVALHQDLADRGLTMIGISMPTDRPDQVVELRRRLRIPYSLVFDPVGALNREFGTGQVTPTHLLISPEGEIVLRHQGRFDLERMKRSITHILQG
jgi:peroxiredoxin